MLTGTDGCCSRSVSVHIHKTAERAWILQIALTHEPCALSSPVLGGISTVSGPLRRYRQPSNISADPYGYCASALQERIEPFSEHCGEPLTLQEALHRTLQQRANSPIPARICQPRRPYRPETPPAIDETPPKAVTGPLRRAAVSAGGRFGAYRHYCETYRATVSAICRMLQIAARGPLRACRAPVSGENQRISGHIGPFSRSATITRDHARALLNTAQASRKGGHRGSAPFPGTYRLHAFASFEVCAQGQLRAGRALLHAAEWLRGTAERILPRARDWAKMGAAPSITSRRLPPHNRGRRPT